MKAHAEFAEERNINHVLHS